ncbi:Cu-oxidase-domain-containing protein [Phellopilus nigrolimitatus]|nr:Cu-oxidase-domain-containing protein [Phellopilus nigrolimitatus]
MRSLTSLPSLAILSLSFAHHALAAVVQQNLNIVNAQLAPDGFTRSTVTANGTFPGPLISGNIGDNFQINVIDNLTDTSMRRATSIHWHGLFQAGTNEMDGPAWVNQCPIVPDQSFLYNFSVPGQSGTYWYHSHLSTQYCDGLRGPIVLYDPNDPHKDLYDVDDETTVITLADWYHSVAPSLFPNLGNVDPVPNTTVINGLGRNTDGPADAPLAVVNVTAGQRYRFRIVSTSCYPAFNFSIDGHNMTIIETDGVETEPLTVDFINIFPAQRYSVVVTADQPVDNYWIRAIPSVAGATNATDGINSAILRYSGANNSEPTTNSTTNGIVMNEANIVPLVNPGAPGQPVIGGVDYALNLNITLNKTGNVGDGRHLVNGVTFIPPSVPVLLQILSGTTQPSQLLPSGSVYPLPANSTIEVSMPGAFPHPMHLHGHNFDVVRVAGSSQYNYANPVRRDTVSIGTASDNVTFRFVTNNAGPWFLHCHIDWHLEAGLAIVFAEDTPDIQSANPVNAAWDALCPNYAQSDPDTAFEATETEFI